MNRPVHRLRPATPRILRAALCVVALTAAAAERGAAQDDAVPSSTVATVPVPLPDREPLELSLYPVRELLTAIHAAQHGITDPIRSSHDDAPTLLHTLRDGIATFIEPPFGEGEEVQSLGRDHLAVVGRPEQHAWVQRYLALQRATAKTLGATQIEILTLTPERHRELGIGAEPRVLQGAELVAFRKQLRDADDNPRDETLMTPMVAAFALQRTTIRSMEQVAYVKDYQIRASGDGTQLVDPVVDHVEAGVDLDGTFQMLAADVFGVDWKVRVSDLARPIPTFETKLGLGHTVSIQLPSVAISEFHAKLVLPAGATAVLPAPNLLRGKHVVVLLRTARTDPQDAAPTAKPLRR